MKVFLVVSLMFVFSSCNAATLALGLKTRHFSSPSYYDKCRNESHELFAVDYEGYLVGTYDNSHCMRSFLIGRSIQYDNGLGFDLVMVSGYPERLHVIGSMLVIPQVTYSKFWQGYGVKLSYVPTVLVGVGFVVEIDL